MVIPVKKAEPYRVPVLRTPVQKTSDNCYDTYDGDVDTTGGGGGSYGKDPYNSTTLVDTSVVSLPVVQKETIEEETTRLQQELAAALPQVDTKDVIDVNSKWRIAFIQARALPNAEEREVALTSFCAEFLDAAKTAALVIFSELDKPLQERTIQPVGVGGVAGGVKFIHKGIFFKLVEDKEIDRGRWLYGEQSPSLEHANKAAGNDLRGGNFYLNNFLALGVPVTVPLEVLLDYHGFRLIAMPLLPLTKTSLVYGSEDAGVTVHDSYPPMNISMQLAALQMHLKGHLVGRTKLFAAGDVEGHLGTDGRMYLLDLARTSPPEASMACRYLHSSPATVFYRVLRPEFLLHIRDLHRASDRAFYMPLNPDALAKWGANSPPDDNVDVVRATELLLARVQALVRELEAQLAVLRSPRAAAAHSLPKVFVTAEFHARGIPLRHLGYARGLASNPQVREMLLLEMIRRSIKNLLRRRMREVSRQGTCAGAVAHFVDTLTNENHLEYKSFWQITLPGDITARFGACALRENETLSDIFVSSKPYVMEYVQSSLGLQECNGTWQFQVVWKSMQVAEKACLQSLIKTAATTKGEDAKPLLLELYPRFLRSSTSPDDLLRNLDQWDREPVITWAVTQGHHNLLEALLEAKASPDSVDDDGRPILVEAAYRGSRTMISMLLRYGANVNINNGSTALMEAALPINPSDVLGCMELLFEAKADPNVKSGDKTVLNFAAQDGVLAAVNVLLAHGVDPNDSTQDDASGNTILMAAVKSGQIDVVKRLLEAKADCDARNIYGEGVLSFASDSLIPILQAAGAVEDDA